MIHCEVCAGVREVILHTTNHRNSITLSTSCFKKEGQARTRNFQDCLNELFAIDKMKGCKKVWVDCRRHYFLFKQHYQLKQTYHTLCRVEKPGNQYLINGGETVPTIYHSRFGVHLDCSLSRRTMSVCVQTVRCLFSTVIIFILCFAQQTTVRGGNNHTALTSDVMNGLNKQYAKAQSFA